MEKKTNAQVIYDWLTKAFDEKRNLTSDSERKLDFKNLCETEKDYELSKSHYINIFHKILKERNIDPRAYGLSKAVPKFEKTITNDDMEGKTTPSPSTSKKAEIKPQVKKNNDILSDENARKVISDEVSDIDLKFTQANVGATIKGFYMFVQWRFPFLENLTEDEKNDLADLWLPAFEKYVKGKYTILAIPAMATIGILKSKVNKEKKLKWDTRKKTPKGQVSESEKEDLK